MKVGTAILTETGLKKVFSFSGKEKECIHFINCQYIEYLFNEKEDNTMFVIDKDFNYGDDQRLDKWQTLNECEVNKNEI